MLKDDLARQIKQSSARDSTITTATKTSEPIRGPLADLSFESITSHHTTGESYEVLVAERDVLNSTLLELNESMEDALEIVLHMTRDMRQVGVGSDSGNAHCEQTVNITKKGRHEMTKRYATTLLQQLCLIKDGKNELPKVTSNDVDETVVENEETQKLQEKLLTFANQQTEYTGEG